MSRSESEENKFSYTEKDVDPNALVQSVLREAYLQLTEDLRDYAEKVRYYNKQKKAIRKYLNGLRKLRATVLLEARVQGIDLCRGDEESLQALARLFEKHAHSHETGNIEYELCIPERVPPEGIIRVESLDALLIEWEERLNTVGEDAQLANVDMQNWLQKQQQVLQMMSNISKSSHDTMMAIIRNIKS
jgi:hypothetical protein